MNIPLLLMLGASAASLVAIARARSRVLFLIGLCTIFLTVCYLMFFPFSGGVRIAAQMVNATSPLYEPRLEGILDFYRITSYARTITTCLVLALLIAVALRRSGS